MHSFSKKQIDNPKEKPTFSKHNEFFKINGCKLGDVWRVGFENGSANSLEQSLEAIRYDKSGL